MSNELDSYMKRDSDPIKAIKGFIETIGKEELKMTADENDIITKFSNYRESSEFCDGLDEDQTEIFMMALYSEVSEEIEMPESGKKEIEKLFTSQIVLNRISHFKLPIEFTHQALICIMSLSRGIPGRAITIIIDALYKHKGQLVFAKDLAELYPMGFYKEEIFGEYVDNVLKPKKIKWAKIY